MGEGHYRSVNIRTYFYLLENEKEKKNTMVITPLYILAIPHCASQTEPIMQVELLSSTRNSSK